MNASKKYPEEVRKYILANYIGVGAKEMTERLNETFGTSYTFEQIRAWYKNHNLNSGLTGRFPKGHVPVNKGKKGMVMHPNAVRSQFKPGHTPANKMPIGTVMQKDDGYMWRKIGDGCRDWKQEHRIIWEEANGPIPEGMLLTFLDGDKTNVSLDNLRLITKQEHIQLTRRGLRSSDPEITETGILIARLECSTRRKQDDSEI